MIFDALWHALRHGTAESPPECAQNVCRERPLQSTWTITNIAKPRFSQNLQKITKNQRFLDVIWVWLSQIEQESAKISRTHALGSNTEMSARDVVKVDEIEHRNSQNAQSGSSWTSTFIHFGNEFSIRNVRTAAKGSILDIKEGPHVNFQGSLPSS